MTKATQKATAAPAVRQPTLLQKLSCASYIYFIPILLVLNILCWLNTYTFFIWLM
jgi:hypothetical protein